MITLLTLCNDGIWARLVGTQSKQGLTNQSEMSQKASHFFPHLTTMLPCFPASLHLSPNTALFECLSLAPAGHIWSCLAL